MKLKQIRRNLKKAKINPEEGEAYSIYTCGHIFLAKEENPIVTYYKKENRAIRSCPKCITTQLVTKYKKCGCGREHEGIRVQSSQCCAYCPSDRRNTDEKSHQWNYENDHLVDDSRIWCERRDVCMIGFQYHNSVPCKNCGGFLCGSGNNDPLYT